MKYKKIIFACDDNTAISPMAVAIMKSMISEEDVEIVSGGIVVLFPEPYNPKIYEIMREKKILFIEDNSRQLTNEEFSENTLVLVMNKDQKHHLYREFDRAIYVYTLREFLGKDGDIYEPYGEGIEAYYKIYDELYELISKISKIISEEATR